MTKISVITEDLDDFLVRGRAMAKRADQGGPLERSITISFANILDMAAVLTTERTRLLLTLLNAEKTLSELAAVLHRDVSAVARDVKLLEKAGLLTATMVSNPGHGRHKVVRAVAQRIELSAVLEAGMLVA